jgi:hypothetical protein
MVYGLGFNVWDLQYNVSNVWFGVEGQNDEQFLIYFAWIYITSCHQLNWIQIRNHMGKLLLMANQMHQKTLTLVQPLPCACGIWFKIGKSCKKVIFWTKCKNPSQILATTKLH